jgi:hypothetical protein
MDCFFEAVDFAVFWDLFWGIRVASLPSEIQGFFASLRMTTTTATATATTTATTTATATAGPYGMTKKKGNSKCKDWLGEFIHSHPSR